MIKNLKNRRYDLEFLRGFSVIIVFFFHYSPNTFNYFYVGVDIFFIISGYVITQSVVFKENFDIYYYYLKRIKRIYPVFVFVIIFFIFYFLFFYNYEQSEYVNNFFSTIYSLLGISNFFYSANPNYFYFSDEIKWLHHTWSLSVEIQYYIFFGLLCFISLNLYRSFFVIRNFKLLILFFFISSFLLFFFSEKKYISDYYSFPGRLWEFMLGSIIFLFFSKRDSLNFNFFLFVFLIAIIFLGIFFPKIDFKYIVFFTAIYSFFLINYNNFNSLSRISSLFIFFGKISFSFYLWHLIILSFCKKIIDNYLFDFLLNFSITTILSLTTYYFIEKKFNKNFSFDINLKIILKIFSPFFLLFAAYILLFDNKILFRLNDSLNKNSIKLFKLVDKFNSNKIFKSSKNDIFVYRYDLCENRNENFSWSTRVNCIYQNSDKEVYYIFGNSYGDHIVPLIAHTNTNITLYNARFEDYFISKTEQDEAFDITKFQFILSQYLEITKNYKKKTIIISLSSQNFSKEKFLKVIDLMDNQTTLILFYPHPSIEIFENKTSLLNYNKIKINDYILINEIKKSKKIFIFDTFNILCNSCSKEFYNNLFFDGSHFKLIGSLSLKEDFEKLIKNIK